MKIRVHNLCWHMPNFALIQTKMAQKVLQYVTSASENTKIVGMEWLWTGKFSFKHWYLNEMNREETLAFAVNVRY